MSFSLNPFLLSLGIVQGILLGVYFLRKQKMDLTGVYFILILFLAGLQLTFKTISKLWLMHHTELAYYMSYHLPYLAGPLLFLYVSARTGREFRSTDTLHFLPFLCSATSTALRFYIPSQFGGLSVHPYAAACLQVISIVVYGYFAWRLVARYQLNTLRTFVGVLVTIEIIISVTIAVMYMNHRTFPDVRWLFVLLTLFIYWVSYRMMESSGQFPEAVQTRKQSKYDRSGLKDEAASRIATRLNELMTDRSIFSDTSLTIDTLARHLNTSRHHLSQVINERFGQSYHEFVNEIRLAEARARLESGQFDHYTVSAVALDCGFSSVSNFNELFKKKYGLTPSQVRLRATVKA